MSMVPPDRSPDQLARRTWWLYRDKLVGERHPQALCRSLMRWETTVLTPSPRIVTP